MTNADTKIATTTPSWFSDVADLLSRAETAGLATADADGFPHACNVNIGIFGDFDGVQPLRLVFVSSPKSLHAQHLASRPQAAITIYAHVEAWNQIHGIQLSGTVQPIERGEDTWNQVWSAYAAKYPFLATAASLAEVLKKEAFYMFESRWIKWTDNRRGFGSKSEHRWPA